MNNRHLLRGAMLLGGFFTGVIGIGHVFMPTIGYDHSVPSAMDPLIRDHFYYLGTYAICGFLLSFAFLSIYFSKLNHPHASLVVCSVLAAFWVVRATLEFLYPSELRIFFLKNPHSVLMPAIAFIAILYSASAFSGWARPSSLYGYSSHSPR